MNGVPKSMVKVISLLRAAIAEQIETEFRPLAEKLDRLGSLIEAYRSIARRDIEQRTTVEILTAVVPNPGDILVEPEVTKTRHELEHALDAVIGALFNKRLADLQPSLLTIDDPVKRLDVSEAAADETLLVLEVHADPEPIAATLSANGVVSVQCIEGSTAIPISSESVVDVSLSEPHLLVDEPETIYAEEGDADEQPPVVETAPVDPSAEAPVMVAEEQQPTPSEQLSNACHCAESLVKEIETLGHEDFTEVVKGRLVPLLQALTAEARYLLVRIPEEEGMHWRLVGAMRTLQLVKERAHISENIKGLVREDEGDWTRIANDSRKRVAKFETDQLLGVSTVKSKSTRKATLGSSFNWPDIPRLRCRIEAMPLMLVGGKRVDSKISTIYERFGLVAEWHETDSESPRMTDAIEAKIRRGKVAAVVILEGLIAHKNSKRVEDACRATGIVYAMADRGGVASLQAAFNAIEVKLLANEKAETKANRAVAAQ